MARRPTDATSLLVRYASDHRDPRNITTHVVGSALTVFSLGVLLSHPTLLSLDTEWGTVGLTPAVLAWLLSTVWYLSRGLLGLGGAVCVANGALVGASALLQPEAKGAWLQLGLMSLALGALCERIGHYYEGRKPPRWPDVNRLLTAPMFAVAQGLFALGRLQALKAEIEHQAGPTRLRNLAMPTG